MENIYIICGHRHHRICFRVGHLASVYRSSEPARAVEYGKSTTATATHYVTTKTSKGIKPMKTHLITATTAMALGIAGTLATGGVVLVDAAPMDRKVTVSREIPSNDIATLECRAGVAAVMCADIEAKAGLSPGSCRIEEGSVLSITFGDGTSATTDSLSFTAKLSGTWVHGPPQ